MLHPPRSQMRLFLRPSFRYQNHCTVGKAGISCEHNYVQAYERSAAELTAAGRVPPPDIEQ